MERLEELLRKYYRRESKRLDFNVGLSCPTELELADYIDNRLSKTEKEEIEKHLLDCSKCLDLIVVAKEVLAKDKSKFTLLSFIFKNKWLILAGISFILSFIFHKYFIQFLVATILLGAKWVLSGEGTRNVIMIIRSLKGKSQDEEVKIFRK